jgi:hypothetical protein
VTVHQVRKGYKEFQDRKAKLDPKVQKETEDYRDHKAFLVKLDLQGM